MSEELFNRQQKKIKEIDRQIKEARVASTSPYLSGHEKEYAKKELARLEKERIEMRRMHAKENLIES